MSVLSKLIDERERWSREHMSVHRHMFVHLLGYLMVAEVAFLGYLYRADIVAFVRRVLGQ